MISSRCSPCPSACATTWVARRAGRIPGPLSERTPGNPVYNAGDLGYWRPGGNFVIFYRHDGLTIPPPGIVLLGKVDSSVQIFDIPGPVEVVVEVIE